MSHAKHNKICLITGATAGIGAVTALELARLGSLVVLHGKDARRLEWMRLKILEEVPEAKLDSLQADLADLEQVRAMAQAFLARYARLDVLLNNAGAFFYTRQTSAQGYEKTFAVNHLSHFLLTHLLLPVLQDTAQRYAEARIVNVSSGAHKGMRLDFADLQMQKGYKSWVAYGRSKLANLYFTFELARRLEGSGVNANALHPGFVATEIGVNRNPLIALVKKFINLRGIRVEEGAQTSIYLASSPEVRGVSGKYFYQCREARVDPVALERDAAQRLWQVSLELVGL